MNHSAAPRVCCRRVYTGTADCVSTAINSSHSKKEPLRLEEVLNNDALGVSFDRSVTHGNADKLQSTGYKVEGV